MTFYIEAKLGDFRLQTVELSKLRLIPLQRFFADTWLCPIEFVLQSIGLRHALIEIQQGLCQVFPTLVPFPELLLDLFFFDVNLLAKLTGA